MAARVSLPLCCDFFCHLRVHSLNTRAAHLEGLEQKLVELRAEQGAVNFLVLEGMSNQHRQLRPPII